MRFGLSCVTSTCIYVYADIERWVRHSFLEFFTFVSLGSKLWFVSIWKGCGFCLIFLYVWCGKKYVYFAHPSYVHAWLRVCYILVWRSTFDLPKWTQIPSSCTRTSIIMHGTSLLPRSHAVTSTLLCLKSKHEEVAYTSFSLIWLTLLL